MGEVSNRKYILIIAVIFFQQLIAPAIQAQKLSFTSQSLNRVSVSANYEYSFSAYDSTGNSISYTCKVPPWISFDKANNKLTGSTKKTGQYAIEIKATTSNATVKQNFMLTVYNAATVNIIPLGNSITNGTSFYNSYRRQLWKMLHAANYNFDFIGSWDKHHMGGNVPNPDFDMDHDGHSGWKASDVLQPPDWDAVRGNLKKWLQDYRPDIVLLELGTNEVFQCVPVKEAIKNIDSIIQLIRKKNPAAKILLAQIPPLGNQWATKKLCGNGVEYQTAVVEFNKAIVKFAEEKNSSASAVIAVDQFTGINPSVDMYDDIHPNEIGEKKMADSWFAAIKKYLKKIK